MSKSVEQAMASFKIEESEQEEGNWIYEYTLQPFYDETGSHIIVSCSVTNADTGKPIIQSTDDHNNGHPWNMELQIADQGVEQLKDALDYVLNHIKKY